MTRSTKTTSDTWRSFVNITVAITLMLLTLNIVTLIGSYPTQSHRNVAHSLQTLDEQAFAQQDFTTVTHSKEYTTLTATPEQHYSSIASAIFLVVTIVVNIAIVGGVYRYVRKHRVTTKPVQTTVILVTIGGLLPLIMTAYIGSMYLNMPLPQLGHVIFMLFIGLVMTPLVVAVMTRIFQWFYDRKHSFIVE